MFINKGKMKCHACGKWFDITKDTRYTASENKGITGVFSGQTYLDAFDCPYCGCQNCAGARFPAERLPVIDTSETAQWDGES